MQHNFCCKLRKQMLDWVGGSFKVNCLPLLRVCLKLRAFIPKSSDLRFLQGYFRGNSSTIYEKIAAVKFFKPDFFREPVPSLTGDDCFFKHALI